MVALTAPRNTPAMSGPIRAFPLPAGGKVYGGGMVAIAAAGFAVSATATATNQSVGRADETVDNTSGANGDRRVKVRRGVFLYQNSAGGDLIGNADIGKPCYVVDDQTVAKTNAGNARPVAGIVFEVAPQGVWVEFR